MPPIGDAGARGATARATALPYGSRPGLQSRGAARRSGRGAPAPGAWHDRPAAGRAGAVC